MKINTETKLTFARLLDVLSYDKETGIFLWRINLGQRARAGRQAGCVTGDGYREIGIDGIVYRANRLAWLYCFGFWPKTVLDHKNRKRADDKINNLREATDEQNTHNASVYKSNKTGFSGVINHRDTGRFVARFRRRGKLIHIGIFDTAEAASAAYQAAIAYRGEFRPQTQDPACHSHLA